ncbi:hypothetical protein Gotur_028269 [Gossypium turneri]
MNSFKIQTFGMLRSHWSTMLLSRCIRRIYKNNLRQSNTNWSVFFSEYIKILENRYDHIPTEKPIIVPELTERRGPLNQRRIDDGTGPSTVPTQSPGPMP